MHDEPEESEFGDAKRARDEAHRYIQTPLTFSLKDDASIQFIITVTTFATMETALKLVNHVFGKYTLLPTPTPTLKLPMCTVPEQHTNGSLPPQKSSSEPYQMVVEEAAGKTSATGIIGLLMNYVALSPQATNATCIESGLTTIIPSDLSITEVLQLAWLMKARRPSIPS